MIQQIEKARQYLQNKFDISKSSKNRNKLGQFATPINLAIDIQKYLKEFFNKNDNIHFLEPAFGTGAFYSALLQVFEGYNIKKSVGYEIDNELVEIASKLWHDDNIKINNSDFTRSIPPENDQDKFNLIVCNPPYVRHHHLNEKDKLYLKNLTKKISKIHLNGLSGLYCYFVALSHAWLSDGGIALWLIPSEFMDVNYGIGLKQYLLESVSLLQIHRFDPEEVQFDDALVTSTVVVYRKTKFSNNEKIKLTFGGLLSKPKVSKLTTKEILNKTPKWSNLFNSSYTPIKSSNNFKLSDIFQIKRGIATGANEFFIINDEKIYNYKIPKKFLHPILPSPRFLDTSEIKANSIGLPLINNIQYLLNCNLPESIVKTEYPSLWNYFQIGVDKGIRDRYICKHRNPWYSQEKRTPTSFLCTYMGRNNGNNKPFRFILNHSKAIVPNTYLMLYPKKQLEFEIQKNPQIINVIWDLLNTISLSKLTSEGRVYGGGLFKLEPKELANVDAEDIFSHFPNFKSSIKNTSNQLTFNI